MSENRQQPAHGAHRRDAPHDGLRLTYYDHACPSCGSSLASKDILLRSYKCHGCGRESAKRERNAVVNDWSVLEPSAPPFVEATAKWLCSKCNKPPWRHGPEVAFGHLRLSRMCDGWVRSEPCT